MKTKIINTKEFYCDDDHPIVYYVVDENNEGVCEYCYTKFRYEPKDERTPSEKLQDEIEPIPSYPCPMHEDYDDVDYKVADYYDEIKDVEEMRRKK